MSPSDPIVPEEPGSAPEREPPSQEPGREPDPTMPRGPDVREPPPRPPAPGRPPAWA